MKLFAVGLLALAPALGAVKVGDPAPDIVLDSLSPERPASEVTLAALKGKAVVLEFWATWCGPCVDAIPHLNEMVDQFAGKPIEFLSITDEDRDVVLPFLQKRPIHGSVGFAKALRKTYGFDGIPQTVLIDAGGKIVGVTHPARLKAEHLESLLAGKPVNLPPPFDMSIVRSGPDDGPAPMLDIIVRPSTTVGSSGMASGAGKYQQKGVTLRALMASVFEVQPTFAEGNALEDQTRYDVSVTAPRPEDAEMRRLLPDLMAMAFRVTARKEKREVSGWILKSPGGKPDSLTEAASRGGSSRAGRGELSMTGMDLSQLARALQSALGKPVSNQTGIAGRYDFSLKWDAARPESLLDALKERGFEMEPATLPVDYLVVTRK